MEKLPFVEDYRDLLAYRKSRQLSREIFTITRRFPRDEIHSLTDQIRRSSRLIGAQIAEAWGKRRYEKHFISKLTDADAERLETQHWLETALDCEYMTHSQVDNLLEKFAEIGRLINGMIAKAETFCNLTDRTVRESNAVYFVNTNDDAQVNSEQ